MSFEAVPTKAELRCQLRLRLKNLSEAARTQASARAVEQLREQAIWQKASTVLFYSAIAGELELSALMKSALESGMAVLLPRFDAEKGAYEAVRITSLQQDCALGKFGIFEPGPRCEARPLYTLDLALVPGLGFDLAGRRLGRGLGYYDRLLSRITGAKCGVAYDQQILGKIPAEGHDVRMDFILTPTRLWEVSE